MKIDKTTLMMSGVIVGWIGIAAFSRVITLPHNATPFAALAILSGYAFRKDWAIFMTLVSLCISDVLLSLMQPYPMFGDWSLFTYSGFMLVAYFAPQMNKTKRKMAIWEYVLLSTLVYWIWTNLGTWLTSGMYTHDAQGFFECYIMALPYLRDALIGTFGYTLIFLPVVKKLVFRLTQEAHGIIDR